MADKKSVYIKYPDDKTRAFATSNIDLPFAIARKHKNLTMAQSFILLTIVGEYDANKQTPYKLSYQDFEDRTDWSIQIIKRAIKVLLDKGLIIRVTDRQGKAKSEYTPNVDVLHKLLLDYWDFLYGKDAPHTQERCEMNKKKNTWKNR